MRLCSVLLLVTTCSTASTVTDTFTVSATITNGCILGSTTASTTQLGTIDFGTVGDLSSNVDVVSSSGSGSVVVTCTPGTAMSIALDYGLNGGSSSARYLSNSTSSNKLAYQLYRDASRSTVWGTGALAYSIASFPATTQTFPVYARLLTSGTVPAAGTYNDTVTVTLTW